MQAKKFSYKGRVRIIFYALKDIQAGDELFYDYNGGLFHEYPTDNFKVWFLLFIFILKIKKDKIIKNHENKLINSATKYSTKDLFVG